MVYNTVSNLSVDTARLSPAAPTSMLSSSLSQTLTHVGKRTTQYITQVCMCISFENICQRWNEKSRARQKSYLNNRLLLIFFLLKWEFGLDNATKNRRVEISKYQSHQMKTIWWELTSQHTEKHQEKLRSCLWQDKAQDHSCPVKAEMPRNGISALKISEL